MDIGRTIRNIRTRKGLKAGELAQRLGVSKSYISRIEREHRRINTDLLEKIGKILEVPPSILLGEGDEQDALGLVEELDAVRSALFEEKTLHPRFVDRAVSWLALAALPKDGAFETAADWEMSFLQDLGGDDSGFRRLLKRFQDIRLEILPLNPRPQTPYSRFREGSTAALRGLSDDEKTQLVAALLPSLLRVRMRWPKALSEIPIFLPRPGGNPGTTPLHLPTLPSSNETGGTAKAVEILPERGSENLRAAVIEDSSMSPKYEPGDMVVFTTSRAARGGERAVVGLKEGGWAVRIYRKRGQFVQLTPLNPLYEPMFLDPADVLWAYPVMRSLSD
jgi:transcriptional regulator with XRE-family HTH domain